MPKYFIMNSKTYMKYSIQDYFDKVSESLRKNPIFVKKIRKIAAIKHPLYEFGTHVQARPLVEVFGVSIHRYDSALSNELKISGTIQATNVGGCDITVDLYNRGDENPESICWDGFLSLIGPWSNDCPILPSHDTKLKVHLKDVTEGKDIEIIQRVIDISSSAQDDSEAVKVLLVEGKFGFAAVRYATFYSALVAEVDVRVVFKGNQECSCGRIGRDIYGSIIAQYCNKYEYSNNIVPKDIQRNRLSRVLFKKSRNQSECVEHEGHIDLCNSMVAVPAYSSLVIELDLLNSETELKIVQDRVEISPTLETDFQKDLEGHDCVIQVLVNWHLPDMLLVEKEKSSTKDHPRSHQLLSHRSPNTPTGLPTARMEVFSIFIGHNSYKDLSVYGRIVVVDNFSKCSIFKRDKNRPQRLSPASRTVSIGGCHEAFDGPCIIMDVDLMDINGGLTIKGRIGWNNYVLERKQKWYNKRICSVIRGEGGYAAVHYTIFSDAVQARVRVSVITKDSSLVYPEVYGTLVAQYSCCNYSNSYESKYYRTTLYDKPPGNGLELHGHRRLPLSKAAIAVPVDSSLIIDVDLYVGSLPGLVFGKRNDPLNGTNQDVEHIRTSKEFKYDGVRDTCERILGQCYDVDLTIKWG